MVDFPKIKADLEDLCDSMQRLKAIDEYGVPMNYIIDLRRSIDDIENMNCQNCVKKTGCPIRQAVHHGEEDETFGCTYWEGE